MGKAVDLTGKRFGKLVALHPTKNRDTAGSVMWECHCDCGKNKLIRSNSLLSNNSTSCGCKQAEHMGKLQPLCRQKREECAKEFRKTDCVEHTKLCVIGSKKLSARNTSGVKGVSWDCSRGKWKASLMIGGVTHHLGRYTKIEEAIAARTLAEERYFEPVLERYTANADDGRLEAQHEQAQSF